MLVRLLTCSCFIDKIKMCQLFNYYFFVCLVKFGKWKNAHQTPEWWKALFSLSDAPKTKAVCYKMYVKRQFWWNTPKKQGLHPTSENERTKLVHGLSVLPPHASFIMVCSWTKMFGLVALTTQGCIAHSASIKRVFFPSCLNVAHGLLFFRYCSKVWKFKINSNLPTSAGEILQSW